MFQVAYYDNVTCPMNKAELMQELCWNILCWVETHNVFLTIKSKERPAFRPLRHGRYWMFWRKIPAKEIYRHYPQHIRDKIRKLRSEGKLGFEYKRGDIQPAMTADAVIVTLHGEIAFKMIDQGIKRIIFFDQHHLHHHNGIMRYAQYEHDKHETVVGSRWVEFAIKDEVEFFDEPKQITSILDERFERWQTEYQDRHG